VFICLIYILVYLCRRPAPTPAGRPPRTLRPQRARPFCIPRRARWEGGGDRARI